MSQDAQLRREECRRAVRTHLYARQAVAQSADTIRRGLSREHDFDLSEVSAACLFLTGLTPPQLKGEPEPMGSTLHYQITAAGILAEERGQ